MASEDKIKTAVITGGHGYDVIGFRKLFRGVDGVDAYVQHIDDFCFSSRQIRDQYDVVIFYIMMIETPRDEGLPWYSGKQMTALDHLGATGQGILVLHHALLAYPNWEKWDDIVGVKNRTVFDYKIGEKVSIDVANPDHSIAEGLPKSWQMIDETYKMPEPGIDSQVILTTETESSMRNIAWTRSHGKSRVFCLQSGHDERTWQSVHFKRVLLNGIRWLASRI